MSISTSTYPADWQLDEREINEMKDAIQAALSTTNGDTGPVTVTARQLTLLLEAYDKSQRPDCPSTSYTHAH